MWHIGIDLHRRTVVMSEVSDSGEVVSPVTIECRNTNAILNFLQPLKPFRAVVEATATCRSFSWTTVKSFDAYYDVLEMISFLPYSKSKYSFLVSNGKNQTLQKYKYLHIFCGGSSSVFRALKNGIPPRN